MEVFTVAESLEPIRCRNGLVAPPDYGLEDCDQHWGQRRDRYVSPHPGPAVWSGGAQGNGPGVEYDYWEDKPLL